MADPHLSRDEFLAHIQYVRDDIARVEGRVIAQNGRLGTAENDIAVLKDRGVRKSDPTARWTAVGVGLLGALVEVIKRMSGASQ